MRLVGCLWLGMMSASISANSLIDLYHSKYNASLWLQRELEITDVTEYMYRHYSRLIPTHSYIRQILDHQFVNKYNRNLYDSLSGGALHPVAERQLELLSNHVDHYLEHLPKLEFSSYLPLFYPKQVIERYRVGLGVYEPGYVTSYTSLPYAVASHDDFALQQPPEIAEAAHEYVKVIAEIQGKRGRILQRILDPNMKMVLWPRKTYYKIIEKQYIEADNLYLFRYQEISAAEARALPRIITSYEGTTVSKAVPECNVE
jgi:hypothetical protein